MTGADPALTRSPLQDPLQLRQQPPTQPDTQNRNGGPPGPLLTTPSSTRSTHANPHLALRSLSSVPQPLSRGPSAREACPPHPEVPRCGHPRPPRGSPAAPPQPAGLIISKPRSDDGNLPPKTQSREENPRQTQIEGHSANHPTSAPQSCQRHQGKESGETGAREPCRRVTGDPARGPRAEKRVRKQDVGVTCGLYLRGAHLPCCPSAGPRTRGRADAEGRAGNLMLSLCIFSVNLHSPKTKSLF